MIKVKNITFRSVAFMLLTMISFQIHAQSERAERRLIKEGNKLYIEREFRQAADKYEQALRVNDASAVARYNLALSQIRQVTDPKDTTARSTALLDQARKGLSAVAALAKEKPGLAAKANYNLGNLEFNTDRLKEAISYYKQALRIDPNDNAARKNLRIAQLKQQNQDQNKDNNQNQNQQQQQQEQQNQDKQQNQDNQQNQDKQQQKQDDKMSEQTANQILQAVDNKENQTRARVNRASKGDKSAAAGRRSKRW